MDKFVNCMLLWIYGSLVATEEESKRMKSQMSEVKARHKVEIEQVNGDKERELSEIHDRYRHLGQSRVASPLS